MNYSLQINAHGNRIVCKGTDRRNSYQIVFVGSYAGCQAYQPGFQALKGIADTFQRGLLVR